MGCTLNCDPNWLNVFSPRIASTATRALNFGLYCFLVVVIDLSFVNDSAEILAYCVVRNLGSTIVFVSGKVALQDFQKSVSSRGFPNE
jgi:hypothetical protein